MQTIYYHIDIMHLEVHLGSKVQNVHIILSFLLERTMTRSYILDTIVEKLLVKKLY